jgi:hypothetical protein
MMRCNLGNADRIGRLIAGAAIIAAGVAFRSWWGLLGMPLVVNALMGVCGLYRLLGISTHKNGQVKRPNSVEGN